MHNLPAALRSRLAGRPQLRQIAGNTGWLFADRIVRMGIGLFVTVAVARYLGPAQFGILNYALAFVALFSALASLGLDSIVVRELVREPAARDSLLGTAFLLRLVGGGATLLLCGAVIGLLRPADPLLQLVVAITAAGLVLQAFEVIDFWFQSQVQSKYVVMARTTAFLVVALLKIGLIAAGASLVAFAWAGLLEVLLMAGGLAAMYRLTGGRFRHWRPELARARRLLHDSWPLILSVLLIMIYMKIDQVMLGEMVGSAEVGLYSTAVRLAEVWYFIPVAIASSTFPSIVAVMESDPQLFYRRLQQLYNLLALLAYLVAIPLTFLAPWLVTLLFGPAYQAAGPMLSILVWAGLFTSLGVARSSFLMAKNWTRLHSLTVLVGSLVNIGLNLLLIPRFGGVGAAIATCVAYWVAAHGSCFLFRPLFKTGIMLTRALVYPSVKLW